MSRTYNRGMRDLALYCALVAGLLTMPFQLASCGDSGSRPHIHYDGYPVTHVPQSRQTLVRQRLPNGFILSIRAERYRYLGKASSAISTALDDPRVRHAPESTLTQVPIGERGLNETGPLSMGIERECLGSYELVVAFGLLRSSRDIVVARGRGAVTVLQKVSIPARFHAGGVVVYAVLPRVPSNVIVRATEGKIVADTSYAWQIAHSRSCRR
jgi:hypothetical protein